MSNQNNYATKQGIQGLGDKLETKIDQSIADIATIVKDYMTHVDERFNKVEGRLDNVENRLGSVEGRLDNVERRLDTVEKRLDTVVIKIDHLEHSQTKTNLLLEAMVFRLDGICGQAAVRGQ